MFGHIRHSHHLYSPSVQQQQRTGGFHPCILVTEQWVLPEQDMYVI